VLSIVKWPEIAGNKGSDAALDAIFFEASGTKTFASDEVRAAFRERWLGRYLRLYSNWVYAAVDSGSALQGYLLGCLDDPAQTPLFSDIGYFQNFAPLTAHFPAQLHVNLAPAARGRGAGSALVSAFVHDAAEAACPGVHVVTGRDQRNVGFYARNGFRDEGHAIWNGRELVFLARTI
jgi:GNAT superfamily N-acetyltransferase